MNTLYLIKNLELGDTSALHLCLRPLPPRQDQDQFKLYIYQFI